MKLSRILLLAFLAMSLHNIVAAQLPMYNSDFVKLKRVRSKGELGDSLRIMGIVDRAYDIQGSRVIEYYEMSTAKFLGFAGDTSQFEITKLPYLTRTPMMRRLVREYGPATAHDIRQGAFKEGMLQKDILAIHGWPEKRHRKEGRKVWVYEKFTLEFEKQELVNVVRAGSGS